MNDFHLISTNVHGWRLTPQTYKYIKSSILARYMLYQTKIRSFTWRIVVYKRPLGFYKVYWNTWDTWCAYLSSDASVRVKTPLGLAVVPLVYIINVWSHWKRVRSRGEEEKKLSLTMCTTITIVYSSSKDIWLSYYLSTQYFPTKSHVHLFP